MSTAISDSIRKVGWHTAFLTLFTICFFFLGMVTIFKLSSINALSHLERAPLVVLVSIYVNAILALLALFFWLSTPVMIYRALRTMRPEGLGTSWGWIVASVLMGGLFFMIGSIVIGLMFHYSKSDTLSLEANTHLSPLSARHPDQSKKTRAGTITVAPRIPTISVYPSSQFK